MSNATIDSQIDILEKLKEFSYNKRDLERISGILRMRLERKTLKEIGNFFGVTQERIRQQEAKGLEILRSQ